MCSSDLDNMNKERVAAALRAEGVQVESGGGYPFQHFQPAYSEARQRVSALLQRDLGPVEKKLPVTESVHNRLFSLPVFPQGTPELMKQYVKAFKKVSESRRDIPEAEKAAQTQTNQSRRLIR